MASCVRGVISTPADNNDINIFLSLENPCTFLLPNEKTWKHIFNTNSEFLQNCTEKQIILFKTTVNCLFNDTCYLVIGCFDWKTGVFQQIVVRGLLYPEGHLPFNCWRNFGHCWTPLLDTNISNDNIQTIKHSRKSSTTTKHGKRNSNLALMLLWGVITVEKWTCRDTYIVTS